MSFKISQGGKRTDSVYLNAACIRRWRQRAAHWRSFVLGIGTRGRLRPANWESPICLRHLSDQTSLRIILECRPLSRPQAQLSRSTFALHYVWFLGCPRCPRKSRLARCWWRWLGGVVAAPVAPLAFGRWLRCVVKVSGEISDVLPSDAHQMARYQCWIQRKSQISPISAKIPIHPGFGGLS